MAELALRGPRTKRRTTTLAWIGIAIAAFLLFAQSVAIRPMLPGDPAVAAALDQILLWYSLLPRAAVAILSGASLGLAGALLQRVLRNPIADPSTLGITAGAQLALTLAAASTPLLDGVPREGLAVAGGAAVVSIVLALGWKRGLDPVTVVISGMTISLVASALSAAVILANGEYVLSLFIWGSGSLHQQSWDSSITLAVRLLLGAIAAALLLRPLTVLGLEDSQAAGLGVALRTTRFLIVAVAVWLACSVTAEVGVIGFVGLAAPALARMSGARSQRQILILGPILGALLLWLTDGLVQLFSAGGNDIIPTGAATGLLGGPVLLWLLPRLSMSDRPALHAAHGPSRRLAQPWRAVGWLTLLGSLIVVGALAAGRTYSGWSFDDGGSLVDLLPFRGPRVAAALAAGALLGAAGTIMQRLTGNPMASPEVLGVSAGAGVGLSVVLLLMASPGSGAMMAGSAAGSLAALLAVLAFGASSGFGPERLLLAGIALGTSCLAIMAAVLATGSAQSFLLLVWMSGSTDRMTPVEALVALAMALVLMAPLALLSRWLDILPLGGSVSRALGIPLRASWLILSLLAAVMTALASFIVGPLSLVGLIAPHLARVLGFSRAMEQWAASALIGSVLMVLADWIGRTIIFPYQIPVGLFVSLLGGPYLIWLLQRRGANA